MDWKKEERRWGMQIADVARVKINEELRGGDATARACAWDGADDATIPGHPRGPRHPLIRAPSKAAVPRAILTSFVGRLCCSWYERVC